MSKHEITTQKSEDGYTLRIVGQRVDIIKGGRVLSTMRLESWKDIHAELKMSGELIAAGQLGRYC